MFEIVPKKRKKKRGLIKKEIDPIAVITILYILGMGLMWLTMKS